MILCNLYSKWFSKRNVVENLVKEMCVYMYFSAGICNYIRIHVYIYMHTYMYVSYVVCIRFEGRVPSSVPDT